MMTRSEDFKKNEKKTKFSLKKCKALVKMLFLKKSLSVKVKLKNEKHVTHHKRQNERREKSISRLLIKPHDFS